MVRDQGLAIRHFIHHLRQASIFQKIVCLRLKGLSQRQLGVRAGVSKRGTGKSEDVSWSRATI